ncbi:hypothetical protein ABH915_001207 [Arthrobacter sp. MW3 TE3886]
MTTLWSTGFCQLVGSAQYRPGTWQSRISAQQFQWLGSAAASLGTDSSRQPTASQSLIMTAEGQEWRVEEHDPPRDPNYWLISSIIHGIVSRAVWAPLDPSGVLDYYGFSLQPPVYLESGDAKATGHAVNGGVFVLAGATASTSEAPSLNGNYKLIRREMIDKDQLHHSGEHLILTEHVYLDSPSKAACVLTGSTSNGRQIWKTATGEPISRLPGYADYT